MEALLALIQNVSIIFAAILVFDLFPTRGHLQDTLGNRLALGAVLSVLVVVVMLTPWKLAPGVVFDPRSVLISVSGLFFGTLPTFLCMAMSAAYRLYQGGQGALTGVCVILVSGGIGMAWRYVRKKPLHDISWGELFLFGLAVHAAMLLCMFTLPWATALFVLSRITLPVLLIYPMGTVLTGALLAKRLHAARMREDLEESEALFRRLFEDHAAVKLLLDPETGRIIDANHAAAAFYGWPRERLREMRIEEINTLLPEDVRDQMARAKDQEQKHLEFRHRLADGSVRDVEVLSGTIRHKGRPVFHSIVHDITERKRAEEELVRSRAAIEEGRAKLALALDMAQMAHWEMDLSTQTFIFDDQFYALYGTSSQNEGGFCMAAQTYAREFVHPDEASLVAAEVERINAGECDEGMAQIEHRIVRRGGEVRHMVVRYLVIKDQAGRRIKILGANQDITERKRAEEALRVSEERFRRIVETAQEGIRTSDAQGRISYVNQRMADLLGYARDEMLGMNIEEYVFPEDLEDHRRRMEERRGGRDDCYERRLRRKDGTALWTIVSSKSLRDAAGRYEGALAMFSDITDRKRAEQTLRQEEARLRKLVEIVQYDTVAPQALLDFALNKCLELTESRFGYIYHYDEDSQFFTLNSWSRDVMQACSIAKPQTCYELSRTGLWGEAVRQRRAIILNDFLADHPLKKGYPEGHAPLTSFLTVPIMSNNRIVAVVGVANKQTGYGEGDVLQLTLLMEATWRVLERRRVQDALQASEERLALALDAANDGLWDWDVSSGMAYFSPRYYTMLGYQPGDFPGSFDAWRSLLHPDDAEKTIREISGKLENAAPFETEFRMRTKSGEWAWILARGKLVEQDAEGRAKRMVGTHVDITERKQAEEARRQLVQILEKADSIAVMKDASLRYLAVNSAYLRLTGRENADDLLGKTDAELFEGLATEEQIAAYMDHDRKALTLPEGEVLSVEEFLPANDGTIRTFLTKKFPIYDSTGETVLGVATLTSEITERKHMEAALLEAKEAAESANRAKSEFLANMSHEIRTPLSGVLGMLHLMKTTALDKEQEEYVEMAKQAGQRLTRLLSDILDLSRIEAGKLAVQEEPFQLSETIRSVEQLFLPVSRQTSVVLRCHVDARIPDRLIGDSLRLQQVLTNLVGNAFKFTKTGSITLEAYPLPSAHARKRRILFSVSDTGCGIPDHKLDQLFKPFTQGGEGVTRNFQGAGLGLSICKQLVGLMGGNITLESTVGQGTTVYFCATLGVAESLSPFHQDIGFNVEHPAQGLRILLAEDDRVSRVTAERLLEKAGCTVFTVENGSAALEALRRGEYDVVLMDVQMPVMDGVEATQAIRAGKAGADRAGIPVIALTAYAMVGDRESFLAAGMDEYVTKPADMDKLRQAIERVKRKKPSGNAAASKG